uniref:Uncharacterized protein n=1 Tax=uncultured prokaryote TaxID=198431 RepID=A0A0H5PYS3_9ZZZZ|nr:hypothetical protein [uncultured prokaryote]
MKGTTMTYPDHQLLQISGIVGTTAAPYEIWSTGIRTVAYLNGGTGGSVPIVLTEEELQSYLTELEPLLLAALASSTLQVGGQSVKITQLKYNQIDANGHYAYDTTVQSEVANAPFGSSASTMEYPSQVSKVLTLETGFSRGLAHRGRMYIPGPVNSFSPSLGTLAVTQAEVTAWAGVVDLLNRPIDRSGQTIDVRAAVVSGVGNGFAWREITGVSMDTRADIQRRRANDLQGVRFAADLP